MDEFQETPKESLRINQIASIDEVKEAINYFNMVFTPTLSQRFSDLDKYSEKIFQYANICVVKENKRYKGLSVLYANNTETKMAYLPLMGVIPQSQNKGIGRLLISECINISKRKGMENLKLEVFLSNIKAINFYKNAGFNFLEKASSESIYMLRKL
ncbi:GNAT family N-acetyltransferase [Neobacillus sp. YIM B06451]|uniref:GNAT family N-acetyltransferase n=1 Tax=Neobacillus sp. YIM B06451 TaxID=3070994 RepID=UPI00293147F1|nr:GNAT family N-acetyltransferase [Neobacillus sp. YIM B06451]